MSRSITLDEALTLLHIEPAIPESDDAREREPHATWQCEPYALDYVRRRLAAAIDKDGYIEIGADPDGRRRVKGTWSTPLTVSVYHFDARPFTERELVAGVFALLSPDRARTVDPTVLDGDVANVLSIRAESCRSGWTISAWRLADGHLAERLWWARGATFAEAADNLRAVLSSTYGVPND